MTAMSARLRPDRSRPRPSRRPTRATWWIYVLLIARDRC